jgi:GNAT superfamily N-acetyltransferase
MSGTLAAIFSFEASKKWIIREGGNGISVSGSGAPMARGWKKSLGFLIAGNLEAASLARVTVEIRAARAGEEESIVSLYEWLFAPPGSRPGAWDERRAAVALRAAIDSHDACVLVADDGDELIGLCTAYQDLHSVRFGYRAWVEDLAVHPERRSEGIGKALLDAAKAWGRERGATHLELDSYEGRENAHRFYEREGPAYRSICFGWEL